MRTALFPELRLVASCCRWPCAREGDTEIQRIVDGQIDWSRFVAIIGRNRVGPLVHHALTRAGVDVPERARIALRRSAHGSAVRSLSLVCESLKLQRMTGIAGLPAMIVKGVPLAILAYGDLALKESADIDLLVSPGAAIEARRLLIEHGYEVSLDNLTASQFERHVQCATEAGFFNPSTGVKVDLHWNLVANHDLLPGITAEGPSQEVVVPGGRLRTLSDESLFAYLCLHGALHNWNRLKWLADLGALLSRRTETEIAMLYNAAILYKVRRSASVALLLCRYLLGLRLDGCLLETIEKDRMAVHLAANAIAGLAYRHGTMEHVPYTVPWARALVSQFVLEPGASHTLHQLKQLWNSPRDRARIALPRGFEFGYHLLRLPLWACRMGERALG